MNRPNETNPVRDSDDDEVLSSLPRIVLVEQWPTFDDDDEPTPLLPVPSRTPPPPITQRTPSVQMLAGPSSVSPISMPSISSERFRARNTGAPSWGWYFSGVLAAILATVCLRFDDPPLRAREPAIRPLPAARAEDHALRVAAAPPAAAAPAAPGIAAPTSASPSAVDIELDEPTAVVPKSVPQPITTACEELSRLAFAARIDGDLDGASGLYARALHANPAYFPAAIGLADTQWERGQQEAACISYRDIVAAFPAPMVPERARVRAARAP